MLRAFCFLFLSSCASTTMMPNHIVDLTDEQWIEDRFGGRCKNEEMLIYPDRIEYFYADCAVRRIVKTRIRLLPKPQTPF